jgi:sarcosine oxidase subunit gamma
MAEAATPVSPLAHLARRLATAAGAVRLREVTFLAQVNLRVDADGPAAPNITRALGAALPVAPNTVARHRDTSVLWLGPDEWLVVGPPGSQGRLSGELRVALVPEAGSVVDVSAHRTVVEIAGPAARAVLAKGCPLDLHQQRFPVGRCAQTMLARAQVVLVPRTAEEPAYWVFVRASFADYLAEWLLDAAIEYGRGAAR